MTIQNNDNIETSLNLGQTQESCPIGSQSSDTFSQLKSPFKTEDSLSSDEVSKMQDELEKLRIITKELMIRLKNETELRKKLE